MHPPPSYLLVLAKSGALSAMTWILTDGDARAMLVPLLYAIVALVATGVQGLRPLVAAFLRVRTLRLEEQAARLSGAPWPPSALATAASDGST